MNKMTHGRQITYSSKMKGIFSFQEPHKCHRIFSKQIGDIHTLLLSLAESLLSLIFTLDRAIRHYLCNSAAAVPTK